MNTIKTYKFRTGKRIAVNENGNIVVLRYL